MVRSHIQAFDYGAGGSAVAGRLDKISKIGVRTIEGSLLHKKGVRNLLQTMSYLVVRTLDS